MRPGAACLVIAGLGVVYAFVLPRLVPALLPLDLSARLGLAVLFIAPLGFAMGMPFPRGLVLASRAGLGAPPFYWGLNGILSVAGSLGTMVVAVTCGFTVALLLGCACYVVAAVAARGLSRKRRMSLGGRYARRAPPSSSRPFTSTRATPPFLNSSRCSDGGAQKAGEQGRQPRLVAHQGHRSVLRVGGRARGRGPRRSRRRGLGSPSAPGGRRPRPGCPRSAAPASRGS